MSAIELKALKHFIQTPVNHDMIHKLVVTTLQVIPCKEDKLFKGANGRPLPSLMSFISKLVRYTNVYTGTLMSTLVYLENLKLRLPKNAQGLPCTRHRIFLSCLILAAKFHNDSSPKNIHWAKYTDGLFSLKDVNLMERQLLYLLNWDIKVSNVEMISQLSSFLDPIKDEIIRAEKMRKYLKQQRKALQRVDSQQCLKSSVESPCDYEVSSNYSVSSISRSSSTVSGLSVFSESHSRSSSVASLSHSPEGYSPLRTEKAQWSNNLVLPHIEMAARSEQLQLSEMLTTFCNRSQAI